MQKGNLDEQIFIVNRGIDDVVSALEQLKRDRGQMNLHETNGLFIELGLTRQDTDPSNYPAVK